MNTFVRRSWQKVRCPARWRRTRSAKAEQEQQASRVSSSTFSSSSSSHTASRQRSYQSFRELLEQRPEISKLARSLREETTMSLPVSESHQVMRVGGYQYTIDGVTNDIHRISIKSNGRDEPELIARVEDVRPGATIAALRLSRDGTRLALMLVADGESHVYVWQDGYGIVHQGHVRGAMGIEFGCEQGTLVYTVADASGRPAKVLRTLLVGSESLARTLPEVSVVFEETNPEYFVGMQRTKDWGHLIINSVGKTSSEAFVLSEDGSADPPVSVRPRQNGVMYAVERVGDRLVMMSNERGENGIFVKENKDNGANDPNAWELLYAPEDGATFIEDMTVNMRAISVLERSTKTGLPSVRVLPLTSSDDGRFMDSQASYLVPIPEFALDCIFGPNEDFDSDRIELEFRSPVMPAIRVDFDVVTKTSYMIHTDIEDDSVLIENNLSNYTALRVPFTSPKNGHIIPMTLAYRNDAKNPSPALWIVYGAYGECLDMSYSPELMALMNRGYKIIWCHVRGDGQLGRAFYDQGRRRQQANSIADLRECIEFMRNNQVTSRNAIFSYSAGAVTACGAVDLVDAMVLESPFVNVVDAMRDTTHALTQHEYDEFGDPNDEVDLSVMTNICPLTSVQRLIEVSGSSSPTSQSPLPPMLLCTGKNDHHVSKDAIQRYAHATGAVIWESAYEGHLPETVEEHMEVRAGEYAFLLDAMASK